MQIYACPGFGTNIKVAATGTVCEMLDGPRFFVLDTLLRTNAVPAIRGKVTCIYEAGANTLDVFSSTTHVEQVSQTPRV